MMAGMITLILIGLLRGIRTHRALLLENLALRHQLAVLQRSTPRLRLRRSDRLFWVLLSRLWSGWRDGVSIVQPAAVIRWQRSGFKLVWTRKSRRHGPGRRAVAPEVRALIRRMSQANALWGAPRIHGELQKLGLEISQATVSKCMVRLRKPPSQTWRTLPDQSRPDPRLRRLLYRAHGDVQGLVRLRDPGASSATRGPFQCDRRPHGPVDGHQLVEACPWETAPRYLLRDRDGVYGVEFSNRGQGMGICDVKTAPRLGRIRTWNGSSAPSAASASTTSWC